MDLSAVSPRTLQSSLNKYNIKIVENYGLNERTGFWWMTFTFDYGLEKDIFIRLTNFKLKNCEWTLEITKCHFLGIESEDNMASFDVVDQLINATELKKLQSYLGKEKLHEYIEMNIVSLVIKKIKYSRFKPQFNFFLSHKTKDKPLMKSFESGLKFLGYSTWIDQADMPMGANLQAALKTSIDQCDCIIAWLTDEYMNSDYCRAELVYAKQTGKIIIPFGTMEEIRPFVCGDFDFLRHLFVYDPTKSSFFEILRRIDDALFDFHKLPI